MKFIMAIKKDNSATFGQIAGHNERLHKTESQLPEAAWFTPEGLHIITPFRADQMKKAKGLLKRKDGVLAVEVVLQVGNQTEWRDFPTEEHPQGKIKKGSAAKMNLLMKGAKEAAILNFGAENIVSIVLHTDESSPHVHVVFTPIVDGKLQAKFWTGGPKACAKFRKEMHSVVEKYLPCDYTPGAPGGEPHDATKAAGAINGPKAEPRSILEKASEAISGKKENGLLKQKIEALNRTMQALFSQLKQAQIKVVQAIENLKIANEKAKAAVLDEKKARREVELLQRRVKQLEPFEPINKPVQKPTFTDGLTPRLPSKSSIPKPQ